MQKEKVLLLEKSLQDLKEQLSFAHSECVEKDGILAKQSKVAEEAILGITVLIISVLWHHNSGNITNFYLWPTILEVKWAYTLEVPFFHSVCIANMDTRLGESRG